MTLASLENIVRADTLDNARLGKPFANAEIINIARVEGKASSVVVRRGTWQVCDDAYFRGHCVTLRAAGTRSRR